MKFALLLVALTATFAAQLARSVTYLRLGPQAVEQHVRLPLENWSDVLHPRYFRSGIPEYQIVEQSVPGSSQKMVICTIAGCGDTTILVTASLDEPHNEAKCNLAWASLAMLPVLTESLNAVELSVSSALADYRTRRCGS
jgi:hypothetical protein